MRNYVRKYVLILLMVLTALLCTAGASTWILLSEKTVDAPKPFTPIETTVTVNGTITSTTAVYEGETATVSGGYTIKDENDVDVSEYFTATCSTVGLEGSADSVDGITVTATVSFTANTAFYSEPTNTATAQVKLKAVAYTRISSKNKFYSNVEDAVAGANAKTTSSASVVIIPNLMETDGATRHPLTINSALTLNSGVSMYLPYVDDSYNGTGTYDITEEEIVNYASVSEQADVEETTVKTNRVTLLNLKNSLAVESGANLYVGGICGEKGVIGSYCELNLDENASISVSGNFYCYGYVKENADNAKNGNQTAYQNVYGNDYDSGRQISVSATGYLKTALAVYDMKRSISTLTNLDGNNVFPLAIFDFPNLQTYVSIAKGAQFISQAYLLATTSSGANNLKREIALINSTEEEAVFHLTDGSMGLEYCPSDTKYTSNTNITRVYLSGVVTQGAVTLSLPMNQSITTEGKFLPFSYKFNVFINKNAEFIVGKQVKFLPGSLLQNNPGGLISLTSDFIFYDQAETGKILNYPSGRGDARLINNGTLTVASSGKIGALIETTATNNEATCDFTSCTSASLSVSCVEGQYSDEVTKVSEGYFKNDNNEKELYQFVAGRQSPIVSVANEGCWSGDKYALRSLNVSIAETNYAVKLFSYQIFTANDAYGTDSAAITDVKETAGTVNIPEGMHVKIDAKRYESAMLDWVDPETNTRDTGALETGKWYYVGADMNLVITPNDGIAITFTTLSTSGNGKTTYTVSESSTGEEGSFVDLESFGCGPIGNGAKTIYIVKGWYYKVAVEDSGAAAAKLAAAFGRDEGKNYTFLVPEKHTMTPEGGSSILFEVGKAYQATTATTLYFHREKEESGGSGGSSCFAEGTMIALADGTQKPIEEITSNDSILVFDHVSGEYVASGILYYEDSGKDYYDIINLEFSNGKKTRIIYEHGLFDLTLNKYVYITQNNYADLIGHEFALMDIQDGYERVTLEKAYITNEFTGCYSITSFAFNYFIDGLFSMPGAIDGLFNIFEYGEGLKYDEEKMEADIEKYGLFTYEDFKELVPIEVFEAVTDAKYFKVAIGKGYITWDEIVEIIQKYLEF